MLKKFRTNNLLTMNPYSPFHTIKQDKAPEELNLIVEITRGDANKYEYNKEMVCWN